MKKNMIAGLIMSVVLLLSVAYGAWDPNDKTGAEKKDVDETISRFLKEDPSLKAFFDKAAGYVVFPNVGKGAYIIGVGYGRGVFFENAKPIGRASITQISAGAQIGGQAFSEVIFFRDKELVGEFKKGQFELSAQASAVAVKVGVGKKAAYTNGVAVFILPKGGLMAEVSIGGQGLTFEPF
jgi:lipid-binding SYLF domain-containing protein